MNAPKTIGTLGVIVALLPYAGMPGAWYRPMVLVLGFVIAFLALRVFFQKTPRVHDRTMNLPFNAARHTASAQQPEAHSVHA